MNKNTLTHTHTNHIIPQVKQKAAEKEGMHACCLQCNRVARKKKKFDPSCWNPCCFSFFFTFFFAPRFFFLLFFFFFSSLGSWLMQTYWKLYPFLLSLLFLLLATQEVK